MCRSVFPFFRHGCRSPVMMTLAAASATWQGLTTARFLFAQSPAFVFRAHAFVEGATVRALGVCVGKLKIREFWCTQYVVFRLHNRGRRCYWI